MTSQSECRFRHSVVFKSFKIRLDFQEIFMHMFTHFCTQVNSTQNHSCDALYTFDSRWTPARRHSTNMPERSESCQTPLPISQSYRPSYEIESTSPFLPATNIGAYSVEPKYRVLCVRVVRSGKRHFQYGTDDASLLMDGKDLGCAASRGLKPSLQMQWFAFVICG